MKGVDFKLAYDVSLKFKVLRGLTEINEIETLCIQDVMYIDFILALSKEQHTRKNELQNC